MRFGISLIALMVACGASGSPQYVKDEMIVRFKPNTAFQREAFAVSVGANLKRSLDEADTVALKLPAGTNVEDAVRYFKGQYFVQFAEPNYIAELFDTTPNDPMFAQQYGPKIMQCPKAWDFSLGLKSTVVAIIDTGIDLNHPDLKNKIVNSTATDGSATAQDNHGHGTHVSGIIGAETNNGVGVAGVSWGCGLMAIKAGDGSFSYDSLIAALHYAADKGAKVVNMSLGGGGDSQALHDAVDYAWNAGVIVVAAAGNNGQKDVVFYPAAYANCISVGSTTSTDDRSDFSNYGKWVFVAAPGSNILSTYIGQSYTNLDGTSMACPQVAGLAGLLTAYGASRVNKSMVRQIIQSTTDPVPGDPFKFGRVNAYKAMKAVPPPYAPLDLIPTGVVKTQGGATTGGVPDIMIVDSKYFDVVGLLFPEGMRAGAEITFKADRPSSQIKSLTAAVTLKGKYGIGTTTATDATIFAWNNVKMGWERMRQSMVTGVDTTISISFTGTGSAYIAGDRAIKLRVLAGAPSRLWTPKSAYTMRINRATVSEMVPVGP